ncbi:hypothetical protein BT93_L1508 [Corymbia citriodora subsp. variegata]|uniref:Micronuclear linker histone polyprotein-like protein n=1 Tax=Corymbia citriodora subsp. variegata TaxID=360336 RepID=A0A8T0CPZ2_CORYI|nr:hypothetical protein BT93_L1508 [Corymbia citriodora subsp. variegata]
MGSGSFKGNAGGSQRGRPYGLMLLLAFGAALLGVMTLHKLRERRISNLVLKDKDRELFSLNLLLQRERDHKEEMKRKFEGMKEKMYALRTQKMELDSAVLEMQSTVGSLKDEMRAMESALREKDNELKMLREKNMEASRKDPEEVSLREILKMKEAEIEDFKQRLEKQASIGSASSHDPSSLPGNSSMQAGEVQKDETSNVGAEEKGELARELNRTSSIETKNEVLVGEVASRSGEGSKDKLGSAEKMEATEMEKLQGKGDGSDEHQEQGQVASEGSGMENRRADVDRLQDERKSDTGEGTNTPNERSPSNGADEVSRDRNQNGNAEIINVKESREESGVGKSDIKLETSENSRSSESDSVITGKQGNLFVSKKRGKKWRMLSRNRRLENKGNRKRRLIRDAKDIERYGNQRENQQNDTHLRRDESEQREELRRKENPDQVEVKSVPEVSNEDKVNGGKKSDQSRGNIDKDLIFSVAKSIESKNSEDKGYVEEKESAMTGGEKGPLKDEQAEMKSDNSSTNSEVSTNSASQGKADDITNEDGEWEANGEIRRQEDQGANAALEITEVGVGGAGLAADKERLPDGIEEPRHSEDEDSKKSKAGNASQDFSQETDDSSSNEYKAETDDSGF